MAENELGGFTPFITLQSAIVTSFHTYPYQSESYEYHYLYSNRRNLLVAMGLWGASPRLHSYKPRDFVEDKRL